MEEKIRKLVKEFKAEARKINDKLLFSSLEHYSLTARHGMNCQAQTLILMAQRVEQELLR